MATPDRLPLAGVGVLVTRPAHQAEALCRLIEAAGGRPIQFPALEILDVDDTGPLLALIDRLDAFDIAIFISPNAVNKALNLIRGRRPLPPTLRLAAVGKGSAKALTANGLKPDIYPASRFDSEALLELPAMQDVSGKKIAIFRGDGGRELIAETLRNRGAEVEYAECYRRAAPKGDIGSLLKRWARGEVNIVTVTSTETLRNLFDMVGQLGRQWLQKAPVVVVSVRAAELARELGCKVEPIVASQASDEAILQAIESWRAAKSVPV